jgi:hypothetical protein
LVTRNCSRDDSISEVVEEIEGGTKRLNGEKEE